MHTSQTSDEEKNSSSPKLSHKNHIDLQQPSCKCFQSSFSMKIAVSYPWASGSWRTTRASLPCIAQGSAVTGLATTERVSLHHSTAPHPSPQLTVRFLAGPELTPAALAALWKQQTRSALAWMWKSRSPAASYELLKGFGFLFSHPDFDTRTQRVWIYGLLDQAEMLQLNSGAHFVREGTLLLNPCNLLIW